MARRNILGIFKECEAQYPKCLGTQTLNGVAQVGDENLRQYLPSFYNKILDEAEQAQRWRRNFVTLNFTTTVGTAYYPTFIQQNNIVWVNKLYFIDASGRFRPLELMDQQEPRAMFGEGSLSKNSVPQYYSFLGDQIELFPPPDNNGPTGGNYQIFVECYSRFPKLIAGLCATAGTTSVTVPSSSYYTAQGLDPANAAGNYLTIRGAGNDSGQSGNNEFDDYTDLWSALAANVFTVASAVPTTIANPPGAAIFVNSVNWLIDQRPQVLLFGLLRQVASYLQAMQDYQMWEARYQKEMLDLMDWDNQFRHDNEVLAAAVRGQEQPTLADINFTNLWGQGPYGWW
jgi:hypothetical protein